MDNVWLASALWIGLALAASLISIWAAISVALIEIMVGAVAGNVIGLPLSPWVNYLAGFGAILLTFLAGTEVDADVVRRNFGASVGVGFVSFLAPYLGCLLAARYLLGWSWPEAQIAGIALSTTSVAVVYAVMVETGLNKTELGKIILAACFVTDLGTVLALGVVFANFNIWLVGFAAATAVAAWLLPKYAPWFFAKVGHRVSEPQTKFVGILPLTRVFRFKRRDGIYTTLLMSTGLTFGSISALYGLTNNIIDQRQYTILLTAVIGSAVVPTLIAQRWFLPQIGAARQEV